MNRRHLTVTLTTPQADALRWLANCGLDHVVRMPGAQREAGRRAIGKLIHAMGLAVYRHKGAVRGVGRNRLH